MTRGHAFVIASILGLAALVGVVALGRTLSVGPARARVQDALVAQRARQLDRFEASLRKQLAASAVVPATDVTPSPLSGANTSRIVYVRPKPILVHTHPSGGDEESEGVEQDADEQDWSGIDD